MPQNLVEYPAVWVGEYVLGLLTPSENVAMERQLRADDALRAEYHGWITRLSGYNASFPEAPVGISYQAISTRLFGAPVRPAMSPRLKFAVIFAAAVVIVVKLALIFEIFRYFTR